ncbi:MAG TPA: universal stress protein [Candidatus Acidoferrum sp.]|nr:universal stress protein [Candidatus Acidoferrum sp.]
MISGKTLVALRKSEDIERIISFLNRMGQHPHLVFTMLEFRDIADERVAKFSNIKPHDHLHEDMSGFEFELSQIPYRAEKTPASAFVEEAIKKNCDSIIVVSSGTNTLFRTDLASTLAVESPIPVLVVQQ